MSIPLTELTISQAVFIPSAVIQLFTEHGMLFQSILVFRKTQKLVPFMKFQLNHLTKLLFSTRMDTISVR